MPDYIRQWPNQLSASFCKQLILRFDNDKRLKADPQPDYSTRKFLLISKLADWQSECARLSTLVNECCKRYFKVPKNMRHVSYESWGNDGFLLARYDANDGCILHVDGQCATPPQNQLRLATFLVYLNTIENGGETHFPLQNTKIFPETGKVIMFPPGHTHPHEVPACGVKRYILQTWITDPSLYIVSSEKYKGKRR